MEFWTDTRCCRVPYSAVPVDRRTRESNLTPCNPVTPYPQTKTPLPASREWGWGEG